MSRAYSRTGDDGVKTTVDVGRDLVAIQLRNADGLIVAHLSRGDALEVAENLLYLLTREALAAPVVTKCSATGQA